MEVVGALILFILFIFVYLIIAEVFVTLFRITGLTDEKARFQVISMLTNSGYTTREAELVVNDRTRRKLSRFVMMFGYAFTVTIVSTVVNIFLQFRRSFTGSAVAFIPMISVILLAAWFVKKNHWINRLTDRLIKRFADKLISTGNSNTIIIIDEYGDLVIAKIYLKVIPAELKDKRLSLLGLKENKEIKILLKKNEQGEAVLDINSPLSPNDTIVVMGDEKKIRQLFTMREARKKTIL